MHIKFEEALYISGSTKIPYSIDKFTKIREANFEEYTILKDFLFCPECNIPHLVHKYCANNHSYFSTHPNEAHDMSCSLSYSKASHKLLADLNSKKNLDVLNMKLKSCLLLLIKGQRNTSNPFLIAEHDTKRSTTSINSVKNSKKYCIPRKRLNCNMDDSVTTEYRIFYGEVILKWRAKTSANIRILDIYDCAQKSHICSLRFPNTVYHYLSVQAKKYSDEELFTATISFYTKLEKNSRFYNGFISDSRQFYILESFNTD